LSLYRSDAPDAGSAGRGFLVNGYKMDNLVVMSACEAPLCITASFEILIELDEGTTVANS
jgi:hypothetical protein